MRRLLTVLGALVVTAGLVVGCCQPYHCDQGNGSRCTPGQGYYYPNCPVPAACGYYGYPAYAAYPGYPYPVYWR